MSSPRSNYYAALARQEKQKRTGDFDDMGSRGIEARYRYAQKRKNGRF